MGISAILYETCPACDSRLLQPALSATDHTVSGRRFEIWQCLDCGLRFTQGIPDRISMQDYYRSPGYISHTDTGKGVINQLYHLVRKHTLHTKRRMLQKATGLKSGSMLDIGAGTGAFVHFMQGYGWEVIGLEPDETARAVASKVHGLALSTMDHINDLEADRFDVITLWHVLEHVHDLHQYLDQIKKILKPGGRIFIAVPNYQSYDATHYQAYWAAYDVPRHLYHFSPVSMNRLITRHQLQLVSKERQWYDSFYISLLSEKYRTGKKNLLKGFLMGALSDALALANVENCSSLTYIVAK